MKEQILKLQEVFTKAKGVSVELGLLDDLKKRNKFLSEALDMQDDFLKYFNDAKAMLGALSSNSKDLDVTLKFIDKIKKQIKELGVDMPKEVLDIESKALKIKKDTTRYLKYKF